LRKDDPTRWTLTFNLADFEDEIPVRSQATALVNLHDLDEIEELKKSDLLFGSRIAVTVGTETDYELIEGTDFPEGVTNVAEIRPLIPLKQVELATPEFLEMISKGASAQAS